MPTDFQAIPKPKVQHTQLRGRIGGGIAPDLAPHACMVLVHRTSLNGTNTAALGGGSIISTRHVLTAAHLVQGEVIRYQVGFITGTSRRLVEATFRLIHEGYTSETFINDIALIFLQGTATFPLANAIVISTDEAAPAVGAPLTTVGFGFTAADSVGASSDPYAAAQAVADPCEFENFNLTDTHFCAIDDAATTWVCPGDNGAGAFTAGETAADNILVKLFFFVKLSVVSGLNLMKIYSKGWHCFTCFNWMLISTTNWLHNCRSICRMDYKCYRHTRSYVYCKLQ